MLSPERLWRTTDDEIVPEGHKAAAFLVAGAGCEVPVAFEKQVAAFIAKARPGHQAKPSDEAHSQDDAPPPSDGSQDTDGADDAVDEDEGGGPVRLPRSKTDLLAFAAEHHIEVDVDAKASAIRQAISDALSDQ